jgi:glucan phosphoethanolaminetransferase (alkaline phosphatase superfamily)
MSNHQQPIKAKPATPANEQWLAYLQEQQEQTPLRLEEAAKFLSGMIAICLSIVTTTLDKQLVKAPCLTTLCMVTWLLSLCAAFLVIFPKKYNLVKNAPETIEKAHHQSVQWKYTCLIISVILFVAALVMLVIVAA